MEEQTIEYTIDIANTTLYTEKLSFFPGDDPVVTYYWEYAVINNIELPVAIIRKELSSPYRPVTNPLPPPPPDTPLFELQSKEILEEQFYGPSISRAKIPGKSYRNKKYPKGGELKSLIDPDPIQFKAQVVDQETGLGISGVEVKNDPFIADLKGQKVTTDPKGFFTIPTKGGLGTTQSLILSVKDYGPKSLPISTLNGSIRSDISIIQLTPKTKGLQSSLLRAQGNTDEQNEEIINFGKIKEEFVPTTVKKLQAEVKQRLLPYVIKKLLCEPYGVCDPIGLIEKAKEAKSKGEKANEKRKEKKSKKEEEQ